VAKLIAKDDVRTIKEALFHDFFHVTQNSLAALENQFEVEGVLDQVFGIGLDEEQSKAKLLNSRAGMLLSTLYEYAINGIVGSFDSDGPSSFIIDASDVIELIKSENWRPSARWDQIIAMADGRYGLDDGYNVRIDKIVSLANVDMRTVRNAISSGELVAVKQDDEVRIENASARRWLHGRRGFVPTKVDRSGDGLHLENVDSPADFGGFLCEQRQRIGAELGSDKVAVLHPSVTAQSIAQLEAGIFTLPLDAVFPLADFYQVDRKQLLECVMQVFFNDELQLLSKISGAGGVKK
jgi:hypothetical protein